MSTATPNPARPVVEHACQVLAVSPLSKDTYQIELETPAGSTLAYDAGQHLQLELDVNGDGQYQSLSYSIANSVNPDQPRRLQLIIQNGSDFAGKILNRLSDLNDNKANLKVALPMGRAYLQTDLGLPHLLVAAGSGIAKIKAITEEIVRQKPDAEVHIYWSNRQADEFYLLDAFQDWAAQHDNLHFTPILESANADWTGRSGFIYQVIQEDFDALEDVQAYLCGSPQMVYGTIDQLELKGLKEKNCYSDVFEYAPREQKARV
ncbi:Putative flavodoxin oxidoreductase() [Methylophaga frappieri]|uniref:Putative flavodoxin oxidoreductase() n=1 Tax=Methylophaga frappieri (strain ATCC BAA-2434 / DSM 25690 / JAM7) TaxID=754477 RepID=I1YJS1_METFJ|nr:NAD(P)H-flavin reductase [Methylophaga frappieri]AFJ03164.1 Putative flavodoxin oxidoreductase() [Methylophaga frappieri]